MRRSGRGIRNIILRADDRNVLRWAESDRPSAPASGRLIRALNFFFSAHHVDIITVYVRSDRNRISDGLTRWSEWAPGQWDVRGNMTRVNPAE